MSNKEEEELDKTICQQMSSLVELLTTSGKPALNPEIMKKFKKICRTSDLYIEHAFHLLMSQMTADHSEIRLSTLQMIDELFVRSHAFRQLMVDDFQTFLELAAGIEQDCPLPPPKFAAQTMKNLAFRSIQQWYDKFGDAYKKLALGYTFLKKCKKVDFDSIQARTELERRQKEDTEKKMEESRKNKIEKVQNELIDIGSDISLCVTEIENSIQLLLPHPEDFFIPTADPTQSACDDRLGSKTDENVSSKSSDTKTLENNSGIDTDCTVHVTNKTNNDHTVTDTEKSPHKQSLSRETLPKGASNVDECHSTTTGSGSESNKDMNLVVSDQSQGEIKANSGESDKSEDDDGDDDDDDDEDSDEFETVDDRNNPLRHQLGLFNHTFAITVEMEDSGSKIRETEDNKEVIQGLREQYRLVKTKFMPAVKRWIQVLTKNDAKPEEIQEVSDLKTSLEDAARKCLDMEIVATTSRKGGDSDSDSGDDFEDVQEKDGYEADIPEHVRLEAARSAAAAASTSRGRGQRGRGRKKAAAGKTATGRGSGSASYLFHPPPEKREATPSGISKVKSGISNSTSAIIKRQPNSAAVIKQEPGTSSSSSGKSPTKAGESDKVKVPVVSYGLDLEYWENPSNIKAPSRVKNEVDSRVWIGNSVDDDKEPSSMEIESLTNRSFTYAGKFEPVKWKCRAPMLNGLLCERMDRVKCPFHGKIIARDEEGKPSDREADAALQDKMEIQRLIQDCQDPELLGDIEAQSGDALGASQARGKGKGKGQGKGKGKGKGKQKAEKRKYPNLTEIKKTKNTTRSRLESKIFKSTTLKKVHAALDAVTAKRLNDKFGNNFNYR